MQIIVIGAGLIGITTAYFLNRAGHQVTVIERAAAAGMETSYANGSMLSASHSKPWNNPGVFLDLIKGLGRRDSPIQINPFALPQYLVWGLSFVRNSTPARFRESCRRNHNLGAYSLRMMQHIREHEQIDYDQASPGIITIYRDKKSLAAAANNPINTELGLDLRALDVDELIQLQPALAPISSQLSGGIHYRTEETGDAHRFCREMHRLLVSKGVKFEFETEATGFDCKGGKVTAIKTDKGERRSDSYVIAAASYSPRLTRQLGFNLPIKPVKGYSITCPRGEWPDGPHIPVVDDQRHTTIVPLGTRIRVTSTAEFAGYNEEVSTRNIENLLQWLNAVYPEYARTVSHQDITPWTGLRPMSANGVPIVGSTPIENVYVNSGHGHLGWTFAAGSGKLLSDFMSGEHGEIDISDYHLSGH